MEEITLEYGLSAVFFGFPVLIIIPLSLHTHLSRPQPSALWL
jgi:hypothetical protein